MQAFAKRNQKGINCLSPCSSEFLHVPSNSNVSSASQQEATIQLSPDVPVKSEEQNLVPDTHFTTPINSINPATSNQSSNIMAAMKQSMFISCGEKMTSLTISNVQSPIFLEETNVF